jgi:hypothetical protein
MTMAEKINMTGWSQEQIDAFKAAEAEEAHEAQRLAELAAEEEAAKVDPATIIAEKKAAAAAKRAERERKERGKADDDAYAAAVAKYGETHVARVNTVEGAIIIRNNTREELERVSIRLDNVKRPVDQVKISNNALRDTVLHPPLDRFDKLTAAYPNIWIALYKPRDIINRGTVEEIEGKG